VSDFSRQARAWIRFLPVLIAGLAEASTARAASDLQRGAGAAAGIFAGIYMHEFGHALAYRAAGADEVRIRVPGSQCALLCGETEARLSRVPSAAEGRRIDIAGFVASNLVSEVLLQHEAGARSAFGQGFLATNLYSNVAHVVTYYTKVRGRNGYRGNDIDAYELSGGNPHLLSAGMIAYSLYSLRRMHKKHIPVMFMQVPF
jgi:hypothetical protein